MPPRCSSITAAISASVAGAQRGQRALWIVDHPLGDRRLAQREVAADLERAQQRAHQPDDGRVARSPRPSAGGTACRAGGSGPRAPARSPERSSCLCASIVSCMRSKSASRAFCAAKLRDLRLEQAARLQHARDLGQAHVGLLAQQLDRHVARRDEDPAGRARDGPRARPPLASTFTASRSVGRLIRIASASWRSLGSRSPSARSPWRIRCAICSTAPSKARLGPIGSNSTALPSHNRPCRSCWHVVGGPCRRGAASGPRPGARGRLHAGRVDHGGRRGGDRLEHVAAAAGERHRLGVEPVALRNAPTRSSSKRPRRGSTSRPSCARCTEDGRIAAALGHAVALIVDGELTPCSA